MARVESPQGYEAIDALLGLQPGTATGLEGEADAILSREARAYPTHYQRYLYALVRLFQPSFVVETGVSHGMSTRFLLAALANRSAHLVSIDPAYQGRAEALTTLELLGPVDAANWIFRAHSSIAILKSLAPGWDVFLHDSCHGARVQTYEYHFAWAMLRPGGFLISDDYVWGQPPHNAWETFCQSVGLDYYTIGAAALLRKPAEAVCVRTAEEIAAHHELCLARANLAEVEYDQCTGWIAASGPAPDLRYPRGQEE